MNISMSEITGHVPDVRSTLSSKELVDNGLVGVEVELENLPRLLQPGDDERYGRHGLRYWSLKPDGSLKDNGAEFVFAAPLSGRDLVAALEELEQFIISKGLKPRTSVRTSAHIHMDVRHLTGQQLVNMALLYTIFERALFRYCGAERYHNIFCLAMSEAEGNVDDLSKLIHTDSKDKFYGALAHWHKYSSLNLMACRRFGSAEFRGHRGEWRKAPLLSWINILMRLRQAAQNMDIPWDNMPSHISGIGPYSFFQAVFGSHAELLDYPDLERDILEGVRLAQDALYSKPKMAARKLPSASWYDKESLLAKYAKRKYPAKYASIFEGKREGSTEEALHELRRKYTPNFYIDAAGQLRFREDEPEEEV